MNRRTPRTFNTSFHILILNFPMTQEKYSRVGTGSVHCAGTECSKAGECLHRTVYTMRSKNTNL